MKYAYCWYWMLLLVLCSCREPIVREEPVRPNEIVSLGFYTLSEASLGFTPYFDNNTLIFVDEDDNEYEWQMLQPLLNEAFSYQRTFPHPMRNGFVDYKYAGERAVFDFTSIELGAKLEVSLESDFCEDPRLVDDVEPTNYLNIRGVGFNDGDVAITDPVLSVAITGNQPCDGGRKLGTVQLGERAFDDVTSRRMDLGDRFLEIFYCPTDGIVGIRTSYMFLTLKEIY